MATTPSHPVTCRLIVDGPLTVRERLPQYLKIVYGPRKVEPAAHDVYQSGVSEYVVHGDRRFKFDSWCDFLGHSEDFATTVVTVHWISWSDTTYGSWTHRDGDLVTNKHTLTSLSSMSPAQRQQLQAYAFEHGLD